MLYGKLSLNPNSCGANGGQPPASAMWAWFFFLATRQLRHASREPSLVPMPQFDSSEFVAAKYRDRYGHVLIIDM